MTAIADVAALAIPVPPISPNYSVNEVAELILSEQYRRFLSLPVVADGRPVGTISRHRLMTIFVSLYGRDLYGKHPIAELMNPAPLVVEIDQSMESASQYITDNIQIPITEDFIITRHGEYQGAGIVLDLLKAMNIRIANRSEELSVAYANLQASQAQLIQTEKMASLGQMVAGVAHEINTPLGYVRNNLELVHGTFTRVLDLLSAYEKLIDPVAAAGLNQAELNVRFSAVSELSRAFHQDHVFEELQELFKDTIYGVDQISELVVNLKNFSRLDRARVTDVNLNDCMDSAIVIGRNLLKHKVALRKEYGDVPPVPCSPAQINQVFLNLLSNAAQAIETQGEILIRTHADDHSVNVTIEDNGRGIPDDVLPKIFDPFFTTKGIGEGTGMGLWISYQIVQEHRGHIQVRSQVGKGTTFEISLPRRLPSLRQAS